MVNSHTRILSTFFNSSRPYQTVVNLFLGKGCTRTLSMKYYGRTILLLMLFWHFFNNFHNMPQSSRPYQRIVNMAIPDNCQLIFGINLNQNFVNIAVPDNCQLILGIKLNMNYSHKHCKHCFG